MVMINSVAQEGQLNDRLIVGAKSPAEMRAESDKKHKIYNDSVEISEQARQAAIESQNFYPVRMTTTTDGTTVNIEASYFTNAYGHQQVASLRVRFTPEEGEAYEYIFNETSSFSQDEAGLWQINRHDGNNIYGTDSDDLIFIMPTNKPITGVSYDGRVLFESSNFHEDSATINIDAGSGNNFVMDFSGEISKINSSNGNDTIIGDSITGRYIISSGDGNDSIELNGVSAFIDSGSGDDNIVINTNYIRKVNAGSGNDNIIIKKGVVHAGNEKSGGTDVRLGSEVIHLESVKHIEGEGIIDGGDGDDHIEFINVATGIIRGGAGNDTIVSNNDASQVYIDGGGGDDYIKSEGSGIIIGGDGNDTIYGGGSESYIIGGDGNDDINIAYNRSGNVFSGDGDDYISFSGTGGHILIDSGSGNDIIHSSYSLGGYRDIRGGSGNDVIYINSWNSQGLFINTGSGSNQIIVEQTSSPKTKDELIQIRKKNEKMEEINRDESISTSEFDNYDKKISDAALGILTPQDEEEIALNKQEEQRKEIEKFIQQVRDSKYASEAYYANLLQKNNEELRKFKNVSLKVNVKG